MPAGNTQLERIVERFVEQPNGCWHHPSVPTKVGYAQTKFGWPIAKSTLIHRLSWMHFNGDIPEGMVLDHLCHDPSACEGGTSCEHRRCVNPEHLQLVSASDNSKKTVRVLKFRSHCKNGHALENNLYVYANGKRSGCATCMNRKVTANA
jgi:hypothetical protein